MLPDLCAVMIRAGHHQRGEVAVQVQVHHLVKLRQRVYLRIGLRTLMAGVQTSPSSLPRLLRQSRQAVFDLRLVAEVEHARFRRAARGLDLLSRRAAALPALMSKQAAWRALRGRCARADGLADAAARANDRHGLAVQP